jgi:hypothetical protein
MDESGPDRAATARALSRVSPPFDAARAERVLAATLARLPGRGRRTGAPGPAPRPGPPRLSRAAR